MSIDKELSDRCTAIRGMTETPHWEHFRQFMMDRLSQHFTAIVETQDTNELMRLQGSCREIFHQMEQIQDASLTAAELQRSFIERAVQAVEAVPAQRREHQRQTQELQGTVRAGPKTGDVASPWNNRKRGQS